MKSALVPVETMEVLWRFKGFYSGQFILYPKQHLNSTLWPLS